MALMGSLDPRLDHQGNLNIRLGCLLRYYLKVDPAPTRVVPIPIRVLRHMIRFVNLDPSATEGLKAVVNLVIIAYFFLMRPGEYCNTRSQDLSHWFHLDEIELWIGNQKLDFAIATDHELLTASFAILIFSDQKNTRRGEKIGQGLSGEYLFFSVRVLGRRIVHLRKNRAPPHTPIHCYYEQYRGAPRQVSAATITTTLRCSAAMLPKDINLALITVKALRTTGAMSLLRADINSNWVQMMGRWQSDAMLAYPHIQSAPIIKNFARAMLERGKELG